MSAGQKVIDAIIGGGLFTAKCPHDGEHGCVVVWSSGAVEQIDAIIADQTRALTELVESAADDFEKLKPFIGGAAPVAAQLYRDQLAKLQC